MKKFFQIKNLPGTVDNIFSFLKNFDVVSGCLVLKTPYGENHLQKYDLYQNKHTSQLTKNILIANKESIITGWPIIKKKLENWRLAQTKSVKKRPK